MRRARRKPPEPPGMVAHGWIAILERPAGTPAPAPKGSKAIAWRGKENEVFWAAWWSDRPTADRWALPDDMGIVEGLGAHGQAIGAADAACRRARGVHVHVRPLPLEYAVRAFTEGARRRRSKGKDFAKLGAEALMVFGLDEKATPAEVRRAYRRKIAAEKLHPDQGGDAVAFNKLTAQRDEALAVVKQNGMIGERRPRKAKAAPVEQESFV